MKSMCKSLAKRVSAWVLVAVLTAQTALMALPQTAYAADNNEPASVTVQADNSRIEAVLTSYKPTVIEYTDPISGFTHPGVGVTKMILENVQTQVANGVEPWKSYFETMLLDNASVSGTNVGPSWTSGRVLDSQGANGAFISDAKKAYAQAVMYFITGNNVYRKNALTIIRAYEDNDPEAMAYFTDACIHTGIPTNRICIAAEIIRYSSYEVTSGYTEADLKWTDTDTEKFISNFISPNIAVFQSSPDRFMNQHNYTNIGVMSAALFMDDKEGYDKAVEWFTVNRSAYNQGYNGSILRLFREIKTVDEVGQKEGSGTPITPVIQHMEMGRDQAHGCGDLTNAAIMSRMMLAQGTKVDPDTGIVSRAFNAVDIYSYLDDRLVKTADFFFRFMLGYDTEWTPAAFATTLDGTIKDMYAAFSADYRGRYDTINFWDYYSYYRYNKGMTPEQIKAEYPYFYEGFQQLKYTTWDNADGGGDFWLFLPDTAAGDTSFIPKSPANKSDETKFEIENRGNVVSGKANGSLETMDGVTYFHITGDAKIAMNTAGFDSDTFLFRVRTDGSAKLTMSGGPTGTIYLPNTNGSWVNVTYNKNSDDVLTKDTNMYWFTVSDQEGTYVDVDYIDTAPTTKIAFTSGRDVFGADTYVGATFNMTFGASNATSYRLINAPDGASVNNSGSVTWTPTTTGTYTFYVQAEASGGIVALKKIVATVSADRAAAVASASSAFNENAVYTSATKSAYNAALAEAQAAAADSNVADAEFSAKLSALNTAVANLELVSPLLTNDSLTDDTSLDYSKMNVGPNRDFNDTPTTVLLDGETGTFLKDSNRPFIMDFGFDYKISVTKFGLQARAGFSNRLAGMHIYGSNDFVNWDKLTVNEAAYQQAYQTVDVDPQFQNTQYRYLKFQQDTLYPDVLHDEVEPTCFQFSELRIWGTRYETGNPLESVSFIIDKEARGRVEVGSTVTVTIQARKAVDDLMVKIGGEPATTVTSGADNTYTATLVTNKNTRTGNLSVEVTCKLPGEDAGTLTINGTTDGSTVILTNQDNFIDTGAKAAMFTSNINPGDSKFTREQHTKFLFDKDTNTKSDLNADNGYHIIDFGAGVKVTLAEALILPRFDDTVEVAERTNGMVIYGSNDTPVTKADGTLDDSNMEWTALTTAVTGASWGTPNNPDVFNAGGSGMWSYMAPLANTSETGYRYFKIGGGRRGSAVEVELYGTWSSNIDDIARQITSLPDQEAGATELNCPGIAGGITVTVKSSAPTGVVAEDGTITPPLTDTKVKLVLTLTSNGSSADTAEIEVTFKGLKSLLTAPTHRKGAKALTLPPVNGYTVTVVESSNTSIVATGAGTVTAPAQDTTVTVKLGLVDDDDKVLVKSDDFVVQIYASSPKVDVNSTVKTMIASSNRNNTGTALALASKLFDGDVNSFGDLLSENDSYYIIDFGAGKAVIPTEFQLYPRQTDNHLEERMNGTVISGSNDYSNWIQITDAVTGVKSAQPEWKEVALKSGVSIPAEGYRYLKISGAKWGNIGEVEIYGSVIEAKTQEIPVAAEKMTVSASSGSADATKIFDGKFDTVVDMTTDKSAYLIIDFGEGQVITPTKFHLSPRSDATTENDSKTYLSAMNGTTIYGSNSGTDGSWAKIADLTSDAKYGWNVVNVLDSVKGKSCRYLKIANTNGVALSEIEIYGTVGEGTGEPDPEPPKEEEPLKVSELAYNITASTNRSNIGTVFQMAEQLFDGKTDTYGDLLVENGGFFVIDFGPGKAVNPTKFQLHPRATDNNLADRMNGTIISGSNDYSDWTQITDAVSGVQNTDKAWVDVELKNDVTIPENGYRYLKISGAKWGNIAEVRIYGSVGEAESQIKPVSLDGTTLKASAGKDSVTAAEMARRITDGDFNTYGDMTGGRNANFIIDFGDGKAVIPTKFHLYPRSDDKESDNNKYRDRMNQTIIYGSNDNENWTELTEAVSDAQYGWNVVSVKDSITIPNGGYRYLKISGADGGAIAEIEIYGEVSSN